MIVHNLRLTRSQQMALCDIVAFYSFQRDAPQEFVNCSTPEPCETTTTGELFALVMECVDHAEVIP